MFLSCGAITAGEGLTDYSALLKNAESVKSSDRKLFSELLLEVKPHFEALTIEEKYHFIYLTGYEHAYQGRLESAIKSYKHVFDSATNELLKFRGAFSLVNIYLFNREWSKAFEYVQYIQHVNEKIMDMNIRHLGLVTVGYFYVELSQFDYALNIAKQLIAEEVQGRNKCLILGIKLRALLNFTPEKLEESQFNTAINFCRDISENVIANVIRTHYSVFLYLNKNYDKAISVITENIQQIEESNYRMLIIEAYSVLSKAYYVVNQLDIAKSFAEKVVLDGPQINYINPIVDSYWTLYQIEESRNNYSLAIEYLKKFSEVKTIEYEDTKAKQLAMELAKYETKDKDNQITLLNKENQILHLEREFSQETATYNRWIIILLAAIVTLMTGWVFYVKRAQNKLKYLAQYDSLTSIFNRSYFTQNAESMLDYYAKSSRVASLIIFDLDYFKKINDTYGHIAGDEVLSRVAKVCKENIRKVDIFGRIGGEEFAILLPGCEQSQAKQIAEECRIKISQLDSFDTNQDISVTASFGVTDTADSDYELKKLIANADEALYLSKRRGRNQVAVYINA
ncbi:diguanylate cyclase [Aliikangiella maris]|uniref:GGDEF domain-containing protein n=2 Tax=Aliikangiella maris TaxID=3162458 RepID=A0ABV3MI71_9GAMM